MTEIILYAHRIQKNLVATLKTFLLRFYVACFYYVQCLLSVHVNRVARVNMINKRK